MKINTFIPTIYREGLGRVTSPPFDMLSKDQERELSENPYNIINLKQCKIPDEGRQLFGKWLSEGALTKYEKGSFVLMKQTFRIDNSTLSRYGVICLLNMGEAENCLIPHERTIPSLVIERSRLIERMEYQTEPVFVVNDNEELIHTLKDIMETRKCDRHYEEPPGVMNSICIISDSEEIDRIKDSLEGSIGIIADGHHRTKAMLELSDKYEKKVEFFNNLFAYITSINSEGVLISQVHRVAQYSKDFLSKIEERFTLEETNDDADPDHAVLHLRAKKFKMIQKNEMSYFEYLKAIDSSIGKNGGKSGIFYTYEREVALDKVIQNQDDIAVIMPEWKKTQFMQVVKDGKVLPPKSTYFYPKIPSGIAFYGLDEQECHCGLVGRAADS